MATRTQASPTIRAMKPGESVPVGAKIAAHIEKSRKQLSGGKPTP